MLTKTAPLSSALLFLAIVAFAADAKENADWRVYLGGKERNLYSSLKQINRDNVTKLQVAWSHETGDKAEYQANNLIVDGILYTPTPGRKVVALDAATGAVRLAEDAGKALPRSRHSPRLPCLGAFLLVCAALLGGAVGLQALSNVAGDSAAPDSGVPAHHMPALAELAEGWNEMAPVTLNPNPNPNP